MLMSLLALPVTVDRTRKIADQCVAAFLKESALLHQYGSHGTDEVLPQTASGSYRNESNPVCPSKDTKNQHSGEPPLFLEPDGLSKSLPLMNNPTLLSNSLAKGQSLYPRPAADTSIDDSGRDLLTSRSSKQSTRRLQPKDIFNTLEQELASCLNDCDCLNASFTINKPQPVRSMSRTLMSHERSQAEDPDANDDSVFELDAKVLLLGDIGENGQWWTGDSRVPSKKQASDDDYASTASDRKVPRFDWTSIYQWYEVILSCGRSWRASCQSLYPDMRTALTTGELEIDRMIGEARYHVQRTFLKYIENLLRRPGRPLKTADDSRFLLILLATPLLYPERAKAFNFELQLRVPSIRQSKLQSEDLIWQERQAKRPKGSATGQHSGIIKRILGLLANLPPQSHQTVMSWFCRVSELHFRDMVELIGGFVSYRLSRQKRSKRTNGHDLTAGLIPEISGPGAGTPAHLHAAIVSSAKQPSKEPNDNGVMYRDDWQIKAAAKVMSLLFSANNYPRSSRFELLRASPGKSLEEVPLTVRHHASRHSQLLPTSFFYNTRLDYVDLIADFETWESRRGKFSFCQYPMFLSIWAKIHILEHDARRQMEIKARDAFFTSILSRKAVSQYLVLRVRRDCLVDDSLRSVSEVVGSGQEDIKKGLRIEFVGEEGVDAGG